jgi:hypothetical protein
METKVPSKKARSETQHGSSRTSTAALNAAADEKMPTTLNGVFHGSLLRDLPTDLLGSVMPFFHLADVAHLHEASKLTKKDIVFVRGRWTQLVLSPHDLATWCRIDEPKQLNEIISLAHLTTLELHDLDRHSSFWTHNAQWRAACPKVQRLIWRNCVASEKPNFLHWPKLQSLTIDGWPGGIEVHKDTWRLLAEVKTLESLRLARGGRMASDTKYGLWRAITDTYASTLGARLRELGMYMHMSKPAWSTLIRTCPQLTRLVICSVGENTEETDDALFAELGKAWPGMQHFSWTNTRLGGNRKKEGAWEKCTIHALRALSSWRDLRCLCLRAANDRDLGKLEGVISSTQMAELLQHAWPKLERLELVFMDIPTDDKLLAALPVTIKNVIWASTECTVTLPGLVDFLHNHVSLTIFPVHLLANMRQVEVADRDWNAIFKALQSDAMLREVEWEDSVIDGRLLGGLIVHCPRLETLRVHIAELNMRCFEGTGALRPRPLHELRIVTDTLADLDAVLEKIALLFPRLLYLDVVTVWTSRQIMKSTRFTPVALRAFLVAMPQLIKDESSMGTTSFAAWLSKAGSQLTWSSDA